MRPTFLTAAVLGTLVAASAGQALAAASDYRFEAVTKQVGIAANVPITVRLVHVPTGKPVGDAVILPGRLEMMMGSMPMVSKATPAGGDGQGGYTLKTDVSMEGTWTLKLSAKAQGETETITGALPIVAAPAARGGHAGH